MSEEATSTTVEAVTKTSDGFVRISIEKYEEMVDKLTDQKGVIRELRDQLSRIRAEPPVINRTVVEKTAEMAARDDRVWGGTLMGLGVSFFAVGAFRYRRA